MSTLDDAADVNPVIKFLPHTLHVCGRILIDKGLTNYSVQQESMHKNQNVDIIFNIYDTMSQSKIVDLTDFYILCHANSLYI